MSGLGHFESAHGVSHPSEDAMAFMADDNSKTKSGDGGTDMQDVDGDLLSLIQDLKSMVQRLYLKVENNTSRIDTAGWA